MVWLGAMLQLGRHGLSLPRPSSSAAQVHLLDATLTIWLTGTLSLRTLTCLCPLPPQMINSFYKEA